MVFRWLPLFLISSFTAALGVIGCVDYHDDYCPHEEIEWAEPPMDFLIYNFSCASPDIQHICKLNSEEVCDEILGLHEGKTTCVLVSLWYNLFGDRDGSGPRSGILYHIVDHQKDIATLEIKGDYIEGKRSLASDIPVEGDLIVHMISYMREYLFDYSGLGDGGDGELRYCHPPNKITTVISVRPTNGTVWKPLEIPLGK